MDQDLVPSTQGSPGVSLTFYVIIWEHGKELFDYKQMSRGLSRDIFSSLVCAYNRAVSSTENKNSQSTAGIANS